MRGRDLKQEKTKRSFKQRQTLLVIADAFIVNAAYFFVAAIENYNKGDIFYSSLVPTLLLRTFFVTIIYLAAFKILGLYNTLWRYAGVNDLIMCAAAALTGTVVSIGFDVVVNILLDAPFIYKRFQSIADRFDNLSVMVYFSATFTIFALVLCSRLYYRLMGYRDSNRTGAVSADGAPKKNKRIMIVGAGDTGMIIISQLQGNLQRLGKPVVVVDDDPAKQGKKLRGVPIQGGCEKIPELAEKYHVNEIMLCILTLSPEKQQEIIGYAMKTDCELKTTATLLEMPDEKPDVRQVRNIEISDLLLRPEVKLDTKICDYLRDQTVLVTGGGGSIGSEICRQVAAYAPKTIVIFDIYENCAFSLKNQMDSRFGGTPAVVIRIGSVRDEDRLREVFEEFKPSVVFHAAAHKHVPIMEENACEAVKNNIFGTYNTAKVAAEYDVKRFIMLSTDKAVNPSSVMGATKRVTELVIQHMNAVNPGTRFAAVRFGNVLGSNGSVIPTFREQIQQGGPVTVTHPDITRYFMTIPEAAQLVVQAGGLAVGGEVFVLDMGEPVKVLSLAESIIRLSGYVPYKDIQIVFTGLRPGEKLYEELSLPEEIKSGKMTANNKIFVTEAVCYDEKCLLETLDELKHANSSNVRALLKKIVPSYSGC